MRTALVVGLLTVCGVTGLERHASGRPLAPTPLQEPTPQEKQHETESLTQGAKEFDNAARDIRAGNLDAARTTLSSLVSFFNSLESVVSEIFRLLHFDTDGPDDQSGLDDGLAGHTITVVIPIIEQKAATTDGALTNALNELDGITGG